MADKHILHMVTPLKHMSPFDVNMALDAGYDAVVTYTDVTLDEVTGLVQDAIFSRPPKTGCEDRHVLRRQECGARARHAGGRQEGAGSAVRHLVLRRSGRLVHHGGRHGGLRREGAARQEAARPQGPESRGLRRDRRGRLLRRRDRRAGRRRRDAGRLRRDQARERCRARDQDALRRRRRAPPTAATTPRRPPSWPAPKRRCAPAAPAFASSRGRSSTPPRTSSSSPTSTRFRRAASRAWR